MLLRSLLVLGLGLSSACRVQPIPDVKKPANRGLKEPFRFPAETNPSRFSLHDEQNGSQIYSPGLLLVLNKELQAKDLVPVLEASESFRDTQSAYLSAFWHGEKKDYELDITEREQEITLSTRKVAEAEQAFLAQNYEERVEIAPTLLTPFITTSDEKETFEAYCEAKIWELSTNKTFARRHYQSRPSPQPLCEGYYEKKGFFQGEVCGAASNPLKGQSYFRCLWEQGVLLTYWFQDGILPDQITPKGGELKGVGASPRDLVKDLLARDDDLFERIIAREVYDKDTGLGVVGAGFASSSYDKLSFIMKLDDTPCRANKLRANGEPEFFYLALPELCEVFKRTPLALVSEDLKKIPLTHLTPMDLIDLVEWSDTSTRPVIKRLSLKTKQGGRVRASRDFFLEGSVPSGTLRYVDGRGRERAVSYEEVLQQNHVLRYFSKRTFVGMSEFDKDFHRGALSQQSEDRYGDPLPQPNDPDKKKGGVHESDLYRSPEVRQLYKNKSFLAKLYPPYPKDLLELMADESAKKLQWEEEILALKAKIAERQQVLAEKADAAKTIASELTWSPYRPFDSLEAAEIYPESLFQKTGEACEQSFLEAMQELKTKGFGEPVAKASIEVSIRLSRQENLLKMALWLGDASNEFDGAHVVGCVDSSTGEGVSCEDLENLAVRELPAEKFTFDPSKAKFNFAFAADLKDPSFEEPKAFLAYKPLATQFCARETYFQTIPFEELSGLWLELELVADQQDDYLNILTGKLFIDQPHALEKPTGYRFEGAVNAIHSDQEVRF